MRHLLLPRGEGGSGSYALAGLRLGRILTRRQVSIGVKLVFIGLGSIILGMSKGTGSNQPWNAKRFALYGAILGTVVGIIHAFIHAFWSPLAGDVIAHVEFQMIMFPVIGAALLAVVSAIRNGLRRRP